MEKLLASFRGRAADSMTSQELEHHLSKNAEENDWAPATINRYRALISLVYRLGIENGKVKENPARLGSTARRTPPRWIAETCNENDSPEQITCPADSYLDSSYRPSTPWSWGSKRPAPTVHCPLHQNCSACQ